MGCHLAVVRHRGTIRRSPNRCQLLSNWKWPCRPNWQFAPADVCAPTDMCWHASEFPLVVRRIDSMLCRPATKTTTTTTISVTSKQMCLRTINTGALGVAYTNIGCWWHEQKHTQLSTASRDAELIIQMRYEIMVRAEQSRESFICIFSTKCSE